MFDPPPPVKSIVAPSGVKSVIEFPNPIKPGDPARPPAIEVKLTVPAEANGINKGPALKPVGPVGPVVPVPNPVGPVGPISPVGPLDPDRPSWPFGPVGPVGPVWPRLCRLRPELSLSQSRQPAWCSAPSCIEIEQKDSPSSRGEATAEAQNGKANKKLKMPLPIETWRLFLNDFFNKCWIKKGLLRVE